MFRKLAGIFSSKIYAALINFSLLMLSSHYFGVAGRGEISLFMSNLAFIQLFMEVLNGPALVYLAPRVPVSHLAFINLIWAAIVTLIVVPLFTLTGYVETNHFIHLTILSFLYSLYSSGLLLLQGKQFIRKHVLIILLQSSVQITIFLYFLLVEAAQGTPEIQMLPESWFPPMYFSYGISILLTVVVLRKELFKSSLTNISESLRSCFKKGLSAQISNFIYFLTYRVVFYLLVSYEPSKISLGVYSVAAALIESVWLISFSLATPLYPRIAHEQDKHKAALLTADFFKISLLLSLPAIAIILIIPTSFFTYLLGDKYADIKILMTLLSPGIFLFTSGKIIWNYFSGTGQFYKNNIASLAGLIVNVAIAMWCMSQGFLASGAAIACSISYIIITFVLIGIFLRESKLSVMSLIPMPKDVKRYWGHVREFFV